MVMAGAKSGMVPMMPPPNYVDPPTRPPAVQAISILFAVLVTTTLVLRLYTRGRIKRRFEVDDIFATIATMVTDTAFVIQIIRTVTYHQNRHVWDIPPKTLYEGQKLLFIFNILFSQAACQSKLSLLLFTHKMIGNVRNGVFYACYIAILTLIAIVSLCEILFVILSCVMCHPIKAAWDPLPKYPHTCFNAKSFMLATGSINTITDLLCTLVPVFIVLKLQIPLRKRWGVASLFLTGIFVNVASALRIYYFNRTTETKDTWGEYQASICATLELGLGLLCVNIPTLRPLVLHCSKNLSAYARSHGSSAKYYSNGYAHTRRSGMFVPVGDDFKAGASANHAVSGSASSNVWRNKAGASANGIEVLRTVELDTVAASGSKEYEQRNRSDEMPLQR